MSSVELPLTQASNQAGEQLLAARADFRTDVSPNSEDNEPAMPKAYRRSYLSEKKIKEAGSICGTRLELTVYCLENNFTRKTL